eukprot:896297-Rhodomonas_salina.2
MLPASSVGRQWAGESRTIPGPLPTNSTFCILVDHSEFCLASSSHQTLMRMSVRVTVEEAASETAGHPVAGPIHQVAEP